ncbi:MAG TPA: tetratricopeptide repeat protein [Rhizomicrobium sp.]|nr:tetratricopeptide repeat protein [Rhizomicrobium sp.]
MRPIPAAALALIASCLATPGLAGPDPLADGAKSYQHADYQGALTAWRPLAVQGNPVAQNNLGIMYLDGKGVPQNMSEAVRYLSLSAAAGSSLGQNNLGGLYREGKGVPRDYTLAARWFTAAAGQGNAAGMYNLGLMYELGQGLKAEPFHAYMWYALAADQNTIPNAAAHRDALWGRMTPAAQQQARALMAACKSKNYKSCA